MSDKVFWTMKNGQKIDVDNMDLNHLRNALKMVIRKANQPVLKLGTKMRDVPLNGDMAQFFNDNFPEDEDCADDEYNDHSEDIFSIY